MGTTDAFGSKARELEGEVKTSEAIFVPLESTRSSERLSGFFMPDKVAIVRSTSLPADRLSPAARLLPD